MVVHPAIPSQGQLSGGYGTTAFQTLVSPASKPSKKTSR